VIFGITMLPRRLTESDPGRGIRGLGFKLIKKAAAPRLRIVKHEAFAVRPIHIHLV
jgi:hypothetical protein